MIDVPKIESGYARFSSDVRLELHADGKEIGLAAIGPNDVTPRIATELPPCDGEVIMRVDGQPVSWKVRLPDGAVPFDSVIRIDSTKSKSE